MQDLLCFYTLPTNYLIELNNPIYNTSEKNNIFKGKVNQETIGLYNENYETLMRKL